MCDTFLGSEILHVKAQNIKVNLVITETIQYVEVPLVGPYKTQCVHSSIKPSVRCQFSFTLISCSR